MSSISAAPLSPDFYLDKLGGIAVYVDGSWVDICSIITAIVYVTRKWLRRPKATRGPFICRDVGVEFVNAASLFPLVLLTLSFVSSKFTEALLTGNKITLSIAGGFALFALLEDRGDSKPVPVAQEFIGPVKVVAANSPIAPPQAVPSKPAQQQRPSKKRRRR